MSLADCLTKIQLDPDDVAAIQTAVEQKVAGGMDKAAAEKAAAADHLRAVQADVEDVRKQLGAPEPVEIATPEPAAELPTVGKGAPTDEDAGRAMDAALDQLNQAGLPQDAENAQKISAITRRLQKMADEGMPARFWYELSGEAIYEVAGRNKVEADKIAQLMAVYSPQNKVYPNAWMAIKAYNQSKAGKPIKAGRFGAQDVQAEKVMKGEKIYFTQAEFETLPKKDQARAKTSNFYTNLVAQFDPQRQQGVTVDMWMMRAFGYDNDNPTLAQYNFVQEKVAQLAEKLGWKPHQVQAAVWTSIKARWEAVAPAATEKYKAAGKMTLDEKSGKLVFPDKADEKAYRTEVLKKALDVDLPKITEAGFNFADGMKRASANLSVETRPGVKSGLLPGMAKATYPEQLEYDQAVKQALTNPETGGDRIAELLGMPSLARIFTPGAWLDQTNPSTQIQVPVGMTGSKDPGFDKKLPKIDAASREQLDAYAAIYGLLTGQDAVGWHRPFFTDETAVAVKDANGVRLDLGRVLTPEETAAFAQRIGKDHGGAIAVVGDAKGVRLLNFSGLGNVEFHKYANQIGEEILPADAGFKLERFYADSNLVESNNEGETYGEGYRRRLGEGGRSDVLGAAEAELAPRVAAVNRRFSEAYGWGNPGAQPEGGVLTSLQQSGLKKPKGDGLPRTIKEAVAAGKPFELIHWSTTEGLKSLDPKYAGTAGAGAERAAYRDGARKRTHFGLLGRYRIESTVAAASKTAYRLTIDPKQVYDLYTDPKGFIKDAKTLQAGLDAARKAGFTFFYSSQTGPWAPYLFTNDKVDGLTEIPAEERPALMRPAMPKPTKEEERIYTYGQSAVGVVGREQLGDNFDERRQFFQAAYHGTGNSQPYESGKLEYDKVNASGGEGSQHEGWGIYVTGEKGVGRFYRDQNAKNLKQDAVAAAVQAMNALYDAALARATEGLSDKEKRVVVSEMADLIGGLVSPEYLASQAELAGQGEQKVEQGIAAGLRYALANGYQKVHDDYVAAEKRAKEATGRVYTVEIPDDTGSNYLDWGKPLSSQPRAVQDKVYAALEKATGQTAADLREAYNDASNPYNGEIAYAELARALKSTKAASDALREAGLVGNKYLGDDKEGDYHNYVIFQDVPFTSYEQRDQKGPRGGLTLVDGKYVVELFDGADLSTVLHETGHIFLEELKGIVASGLASEQTVKDWDTLGTWLGNEGEAITRPQHEKFASGFETYLLEGKAPSAKLADAFGTFRRWLTRIYERAVVGDPAAGINNLLKTEYGVEVNLTDEVREVFDRLLTLEPEALAETVAKDFAVPPGAKGEDDKSKASRTRIADLLGRAQQHLEERLFAKRTASIAANKEAWRKEAEADLVQLPVYQARELIAKEGRLDGDAVRAAHGEKALLSLRAKDLVTEDGVAGQEPGLVAAKAGFNTSAEMIAELRVAPSFEYAVRKAVKARADKAWQAYTTADALTDVPEYADALKAGADYLGQLLGRKPVGAKQIKDQAIKVMETMPSREATRPDVFLANASRLQRQEKQALAKGDLELALAKNQQARVQWELARMAKQNKAQVTAILDRAEALKRADPAKIDIQYWHAALELAARHGLIDMPAMQPPREGWKSLTALFVERLDPSSPEYDGGMDIRALASSPVISGSDVRDYRDMPVIDLAEVDDVLRAIAHDGRERVRQEILAEGRNLDATATALADLMAKNVKPLSPKNEFSFLRGLADYKDKFLAGLRMWQFVARQIDGTPTADTGLASQVLQNSLNAASNAQFKARTKLDKALVPIYEYVAKRMGELPQYLDVKVPVTPAMKQAGMDGWTFERAFCAALNMGNTYNLEGLARGYGLVTEEGEADVAALMRITAVLNEKDWQTVQRAWDTIEGELRDPLAAAFEDVTGAPMSLVTADSITVQTADGKSLTLRGGYYPIKFDPRLSLTVQERAEADELTLRAQTMAPIIATKSGMTRSRTNTGGRPFDLRLHVLDTHIDDTLQYIHFRKLLKDLNKLTRHQVFKEAFIQHFGQPSWFELRKYLADIGLPNVEPQDVITRTVNGFRAHAAPWLLSFNLNSLLKQVPQVITAIADRPAAYATGFREMMREGVLASSRSMRAQSEYLAFRAKNVDRDSAYFMQQVDPVGKKKFRRVAEMGMQLFAIADHVLVAPAWKGEYSAKYGEYVKTMSPAEAEQKAKLDADNYVRGTMPGSARVMDQNGWLRSRSGLARMFTLFATPGFHFANRQILMYNAMRGGQLGVGEYFGHVLAEGVVAPLMVPMALALLWQGWPPDEEKWKDLGAEAFAYQFSGIPMLREMIATQVRPGRSFAENLPAFAGFDLVARSTSALWHLPLELADPKRQEKALLAVADLLSFYYQVPASRLVDKTLEGWRQMEKLDNSGDPFAVVEDMLTVLFPDPDKRKR